MSGTVFVDLAATNDGVVTEQGDVCVIGAGAAGIYLAVQLAGKGLNVILVEAGNIHCCDASAVGFDAQFETAFYPGATVGRFFGVGGSTSRWGGQLVPHSRHDLREHSNGFDTWSHIVQTAAAEAEIVLARLGWHDGADFSAFAHRQLGDVGKVLDSAGFDVMASLFLPFQKKNIAYLLKQKSSAQGRLKVIYNAVAKAWVVGQCSATDTRLKQLLAVSNNGNQLEVSANRFVIAAGAIESARILLELDDSAPLPVIRRGSAIGCLLSDHLSLSIADVAPDSLSRAIDLFAPRFVGDWMRGFRFIESSLSSDAPRVFSHFIFENQNSGFALAKELLFAMQGRRWPKVSVSAVASGMTGLLSLGYKRYCQSVLHIPADTPSHLQMDIEQQPVHTNQISLASKRDRYGRRIAKINWGINDKDMENIYQNAQRILNKWPGKAAGLPELLPTVTGCNAAKPHDAYHPVATCRMGDDAEAVVDGNMKVFGVENLWVVSTGVLPGAGTANPTFTMLCLAERLVHHMDANRVA
ncbi:GMC oxidoreductase [Methylococcus mesophilus]|uniref:GMC oxidoreductase n=1 Tax=Methylococcus mesophilus TaxID=2993564 RepID=UPI00224B3391|nr:GMC oxidoreductase [Methylococcus mesophilus]UZR28741.1 GMC oxidoreductase [Methylococcus mesophilus]